VDRGAKAAADAGNNWIGIVIGRYVREMVRYYVGRGINEKRRTIERIKRCLRRYNFFASSPWVEKRQEMDGRMRRGRGRGGRWEVEGEEASGGGWDLLRAYEGRSWATRRGHTTRQGFHAHCPVWLHCASSLFKRAYGESMHAAGLVGSKLTVGHGARVAHAWIGGCLRSRRLRCPHGCHSRANAHLGHARAEMTTEKAPDQPLWWK
jgi:hypothetical protein